MNLPIDLIREATPPRFRWRQVVTNPAGGSQVVEHEGMLPPNIEGAVAALIGLAKQLAWENEELKSKTSAPKKGKT